MVWFIFFITVIIDQISKYYISSTFEYLQSVPVIPNLFRLTYVHNYGAAFGILQNRRGLFIFVSIVVFALVFYFYKQLPKDWISKMAIGLALGGTVGNLIDRVFLGYVIDFFELPYWPVFNVADSAIVVGMLLLAWKILFPGQTTGEMENVRDS